MKKFILLMVGLLSWSGTAFADEDNALVQEPAPAPTEELTEAATEELTVAEPMQTPPTQEDSITVPTVSPLPSALNTGPTTKASVPLSRCHYNFKRDFSWIPLPIIAAGFIAKGQKKNFRSARQKFQPHFKHHLDDYLQFSPLAVAVGLKLGKVEGRSDWPRFLVSGAVSYGIMAAVVNGIKYSAKEMRPDGSTANSFPSGHTATAFAAATILHKEYGMTRSPWYSVGGYLAATATGVMRSLNNRHWISDIMVGAGIGILSTDLGYFVGDLIFKDRHTRRKELEGLEDYAAYPSFFSVQMGAAFMPNIPLPDLGSWEISMDQGHPEDFSGQYPTDDGKLRIGTGTSVAGEGAYFFNKYIGLGGRLKVITAPVRANGMSSYDLAGNVTSGSKSDITDRLAMFSADAGVYLQWPVSSRFALGTKATFGGLFTSDITLQATEQQEEDFQGYGDYLYAHSIRTTKWGTGVSLTYAMRGNLAWKLNIDYDYCRVPFSLDYQPDFKHSDNLDYRILHTKIKHNMHTLTLGASMAVRF